MYNECISMFSLILMHIILKHLKSYSDSIKYLKYEPKIVFVKQKSYTSQ